MKILRRIAIATTMAVVPSVSILSVISCSSEKTKLEEFDFSAMVTDGFIKMYDAEISSWVDGDTFGIKYINDEGKNITTNVRVSYIDTPELHVKNKDTGEINVLTTGKEYEWANKALEFGKSEMPIGTKVKFISNEDKSYSRTVGSILYGKNFSKSYEYEIMKNGLAMPFMGQSIYFKIKSKYNAMHYLGYPIANAYNYAKDNGIGMFGEDLDEILGVHGETSLSAVSKNDKDSVYNYLDVDYW